MNNDQRNDQNTIYQNYRKKIFDPQGQERKMLDEVEEGKESAYRFDPSASSTIEGLYVKKRNTKIKYFYFLGVLIIISFFGYLGYKTVNPTPEDNFNKYKSVIADLEEIEQGVDGKRKELQGLVKELKKVSAFKKFDLSKANSYLLSEEEEKFLAEQITKEHGSEVKNVIKTLIEKNQEIKALKDELEEKKKSLRQPVVMTKKNGHEKIALAFLMDEIGLSEEEARSKIENVNIFDYNYEGLYVWNYYENGFYGTFVTKGDSKKSPRQIKEIAKAAYNSKLKTLAKSEQNLKQEKVELESKLISRHEEIALLEEKNRRAEVVAKEKDLVDKKAKDLEEEVKKRDQLIKQINTLYYAFKLFGEAKDKKIIKSGFFTDPYIVNDELINFDKSLDLTEETKIIIRANSFKLREFKKVYLLPDDFVKRGIVQLKYDKVSCEVIVLKPEALKEQKILILAE